MKLGTYKIILMKKNCPFCLDLGPVKAMSKKDALAVGRKLYDELGKPEWKKKIGVLKS